MREDDDTAWRDFLATLAVLMDAFRSGKSSLDETLGLIEPFYESGIDAEMIDFAVNTITEIGGSPDDYDALLALARGLAAKADYREFMDS